MAIGQIERPVGPVFDPPHVGEYFETVYIEAADVRAVGLAAAIGVSKSTVSWILAGKTRLTAQVAVRLEEATGVSARLLMRIQDNHDLWHARQTLDRSAVHHLELRTA